MRWAAARGRAALHRRSNAMPSAKPPDDCEFVEQPPPLLGGTAVCVAVAVGVVVGVIVGVRVVVWDGVAGGGTVAGGSEKTWPRSTTREVFPASSLETAAR